MSSRNLFRRLERLQARLMPAGEPPVIELRITSAATGHVIAQLAMVADPNCGPGTRPWQYKAYEGGPQTIAQT